MEKESCTRAIGTPAACSRSQAPRTRVSRSESFRACAISQSAARSTSAREAALVVSDM
jgi:hypothetical protein